MEDYLTYIRLKLIEAQEKSRKLTNRSLNSESLSEKHRFEVDLSFWLGKAAAYSEMYAMLTKREETKQELERLLEQIAKDVILERKIQLLKEFEKSPNGNSRGEKTSSNDPFEEGVMAMKEKLAKILNLMNDVTVLKF